MTAKSCKVGDTYIPKHKGCFDLNYKIKNLEGTRDKHHGRIKKLKEKSVKYDDIIENRFADDVEDILVSKPWFYRYFKEDIYKKGKLTQSDIRSLKTAVNDATRTAIKGSLEFNDLPPSYDTAFYVANYNKINNMMKKVTKEIIKDYL